jgi:predicted esterase
MKHFLTAPASYRYYTHGSEKAPHLLIVLHGYGQLAEYFIRKFQVLEDDFFIVAPEGMHRFYLKGSSGRVGASWMTKEERELDIQTNMNWLNTLLAKLTSENTYQKISLLGFSQGGATAARWFHASNQFDHFISWASVFPPDLEQELTATSTTSKTNFFVIGTNDEFVTPDERANLLKFYQEKGYKTIVYEGTHAIDSACLQKLSTAIK